MSHFAVLVITDGKPSNEDLQRIMQPWHEFECTGTNDQYVQEIDETEKLRAQWESETRTRLKAPDGSLHQPYGDEFYRDPTPEEKEKIGPISGTGSNGEISWTSKDWGDGKGYRTKVRFIPEGYEEIEIPTRETMTFLDWVVDYTGRKAVPHGTQPDLAGDHKYGYVQLDAEGNVEKVFDRTNPNAKWDWWTVGGRWDGFLMLKEGAFGIKGRPGLMGTRSKNDGVSSCRWGDVDAEGMRAAAEKRAAEDYDFIAGIIAGREFQAWDEMNDALPKEERYTDAVRRAYHDQPVIKDLASNRDAMRWNGYGAYKKPRDQFLAEARAGALTLFGVVKEGRWYERGSMGWWGAVHDEKDDGAWQREYAKLLDGLPADSWVTVVDCHI
jgi:hypothetical protein